jgi:TetR/AcrR family transcriptional repressor of nem operon
MATRKPASSEPARSPVTERILEVAVQLAQTRGFNGFSYADIAEKLLLTKASLHYHFPSKADLGRTLIEHYHRAFAEALEAIDRQTPAPREKLRSYIGLYDTVLRNDRMCLCGMFAAEYATLPAPMQAELRRFFDANEKWLARLLEDGRRDGDFVYRGSAKDRARTLMGALEGAMLVARTYDDGRRFQSAAKQVLADVCVVRSAQPVKRSS